MRLLVKIKESLIERLIDHNDKYTFHSIQLQWATQECNYVKL
jgi:hypothetical protein